MNRTTIVTAMMAVMTLSIGVVLFSSVERKPSGSMRGDGQIAPAVPPAGERTDSATPQPGSMTQAGFREYPIGDPVGFERNHIRVAAVWLPSVTMEGGPESGQGAIHVEADITASEGNPNGFASGEFVPYLKITYKLTSNDGKTVLDQGTMLPMVARDGLHYGTSMLPPKPGEYKLTYRVEPPSVGGLGRHHDPVTGVAPWWEPFEVTFDWEFEGETDSGSES